VFPIRSVPGRTSPLEFGEQTIRSYGWPLRQQDIGHLRRNGMVSEKFSSKIYLQQPTLLTSSGSLEADLLERDGVQGVRMAADGERIHTSTRI
jgi:hypothetical protein